jgi:hypothetical protein
MYNKRRSAEACFWLALPRVIDLDDSRVVGALLSLRGALGSVSEIAGVVSRSISSLISGVEDIPELFWSLPFKRRKCCKRESRQLAKGMRMSSRAVGYNGQVSSSSGSESSWLNRSAGIRDKWL